MKICYFKWNFEWTIIIWILYKFLMINENYIPLPFFSSSNYLYITFSHQPIYFTTSVKCFCLTLIPKGVSSIYLDFLLLVHISLLPFLLWVRSTAPSANASGIGRKSPLADIPPSISQNKFTSDLPWMRDAVTSARQSNYNLM